MTHFFKKRLLKELKILTEAPLENIKILSIDNPNSLKIQIAGAEGTLYANEVYTLSVNIPLNYPIEAPEVVFVGDVPVNEHVYSNGHICLSILYDQWSPALTLTSVCLSIISLLSSATFKSKPSNDKSYCKLAVSKSPKEFKWSYHN